MIICSPFSGLLPSLSSIHNSKNKSNFRKIHVWIKPALTESSPPSKSSSSRTKELESSETSCEWMFTGHWDEDGSEIILQLRGYMSAKRTSRESWQRFCQRKEFEWTKITGGIRFWPQFMDDEESVLNKHDHFTVLTK